MSRVDSYGLQALLNNRKPQGEPVGFLTSSPSPIIEKNLAEEPRFKIEIRACSFNNLTMEELTRKLKLMHDLGFKKFYTIVEEPKVEEPKIPPPPI